MKKWKYFGYICIGFFAELLAVLVGALVAYYCLILSLFPLSMLLPVVIGVFICILFGKVHRYCRSAILWRLMMDTRVYTIFAQILPIVVVIVGGATWLYSLPPGNWGGILVVWLAMIGSGIALFTAVSGCIYQILPPDRFAPQNTPEQTENEKTEV